MKEPRPKKTGRRVPKTSSPETTEKRTAELELTWLLQITREPFVLIGKDLQVISFNEGLRSKYARFFGIEICKGESFLNYTAPDKKEAIREICNRVLEGSDEAYEISIPQPGGDIRTFEIIYGPARDERQEIAGVFISVIDITDRVNAQRLREFERKDKEALINSNTDLMWSVGRDFKLIAANNAFVATLEAITGTTLKPGDDLSLKEKLPPEFLENWLELSAKALKGGTFKQEVYSLRGDDSGGRWAEVSFNPIVDEAGISGIACYSRDITTSKNYEARLEEINKKLELAQQIAQLGYWQMDIDQEDLYWSREVYHIWGCSPETHTPTYSHLYDSIDADDRELFKASWDKAVRGMKNMDIEHRIVLPDGTVKYVHEKAE